MRDQVESSSGGASRDRIEPPYCCDGSSPDEIVISGIAGRFPQCDDVDEFRDKLYSAANLILPSEERWKKGILFLPYSEAGLIKNIDKFDNDFFRVPACIAKNLEPEQRVLLEVCYEAVADSGYDPKVFEGRHISVYNASSNRDGKEIFYRGVEFDMYSGIGYLSCLRANRCSYVFDFKGPSFVVDAACSSSACAMDIAIRDLKSGRCEAAVVTGSQITLNPEMNAGYLVSGILSKSGVCRPFDQDADGMARSEAVVAVFLQKASAARRIYSKIVSDDTVSTGFVPGGVYVPSLEAEIKLFRRTLKKRNLKPTDIGYIEAHGTGTLAGDPTEANAIGAVFCENRTETVLVGTVKSNMGHPEAPAGLCGIVKSIFALESGVIAPNLHFRTPNESCEHLVSGKMKIVCEPTPLPKPLIAVNCFGFGGAISQMILQGNERVEQEEEDGSDCLPRLALHCATSRDGVEFSLEKLTKVRPRREFYALYHNLAFASPKNKPYRGYVLLDKEPVTEIKNVNTDEREVWYILTGMGCQWSGMACDLMQIKVFADSMRRSAKILEPYGIDLLELIKPGNDCLVQNRKILPAFVAICAIQIALIDVLNELGIVPNGIIGHSTGELCCAYADGCCTAEQTILSAYWRGVAVEASNLPAGEMAAVGLTWEEAKAKCPENVFAACHNAQDSVTISGLSEPLKNFVAQLKEENIFARVVNAYGFSFHTELILPAAPALKSGLEKLLPNPKPRTKRWLSTSYPPEEWNSPQAQIADANYFTHNLISNVHFAEALAHIPSDAITIEIGPHFLLQSILKRSLGSGAEFIGLMKRNENNVNFLLSSIGKLYNLGVNANIEKLYPPVTYPVPRGTPSVSSFIRWNHSVSFKVPKYVKYTGGAIHANINVEEGDGYILDHCLEGRALYPATGYLYIAWKALSHFLDIKMEELSIIIDDFKIHRATLIGPSDSKTFVISVSTAGGEFEVVESSSVVATGKIIYDPKLSLKMPDIVTDNKMMVSGSELYSELKIHGYEYGPAFQCLDAMSIDGSSGSINWTDKWIPYLDAHLLFFGLIDKCQQFCLPTGALSVKINPIQMMEYVAKLDERQCLPVAFNRNTKCCSSPGVEIRSLKLEAAPRRQVVANLPILEKYQFVPYLYDGLVLQESKQRYQEYMDSCCEMAKQISVSFGKPLPSTKSSKPCNKSKLDEYLQSSDNNLVLLKVLQKISEISPKDNYLKDVENLFKSYLKNIADDMLYKTLSDDKHVRTLFEIILENSQGRKNVVEVSNGHHPILPVLFDSVKLFSRIKVNGTFLHPDPDSLDLAVYSQRQIEVKTLSSSSVSETKGKDVVIGSFLFGDTESLKECLNTLNSLASNEAYFIFYHRESIFAVEAFLCSLCDQKLQTQSSKTVENMFKEQKLRVVSKLSDSMGSHLYLLKFDSEVASHIDTVVQVKDGHYSEWVESVKTAMNDASEVSNARIWFVAEDSSTNGLIGMIKCLRQEPGGEKIRSVFILRDKTSKNPPAFSLTDPFYADILKKDLLYNVYYKGTWGAFRHIPIDYGVKEKKVPHSFMNITKYGDLSSFRWIESPLEYEKEVREEAQPLIHVVYSALNFKDVMYATAKMSAGLAVDEVGNDPCILGLEFSGVTSDGRRVMGACSNRAMATTIHRTPMFMIDVPDHWTLEDAATVPVVYSTCYYALIVRGQLSKGDSVLIHSGTGGIGIAAIRIALSMDCNVFTTVGTPEKREYLKKLFPQIKDENIGSSRDTSFELMVQEGTKSQGVDVVLNSLADDKLQASTRCLARHGRFIEIGKYDLALDHKIGLGMFLEGTSFHGVFLDKVVTYCKSHGALIQKLMTEGLRKGVIQPLDRTVFLSSDVEQAFRFMGTGKHMGKVLLKIRDEPRKGTVPALLEYPALPCAYFYKYKVYIIIGGLGGFGIQLTQWLIYKGAKNIILTSRHGASCAYHHLCLKRWANAGANVIVSSLNVGIRKEAEQLLKEASKIGPVGGIFNSAVVLRDAFMENQSSENFTEVCLPKAEASKYLDEFTRKLCPSLDLFVCFSSISCGKGNAGQTSYGYANSVMERVCEKRRQDGLHGLAVQWGIIGDVGIVHRQMGEEAMIAGVMAQRIKSCLETLEQFLLQDSPVVSSFISANALKKKVKKDEILSQLAKILGHKDISEMNMSRSFQDIGMDSLVGVEIQHALEMNYDITISLKELRDMTIADLKSMVDLKGVKKPEPGKKIKASEACTSGKDAVFLPETSVIELNTATSGPVVVFVHYFLPILEKLQMVINQLANPCLGVLCSKSAPIKGIRNLADFYLKELMQKSQGPLHLVGCDDAGPLAFEMAALADSSSTYPKILSLTILKGSFHLANAVSDDPVSADTVKLSISDLTEFTTMLVHTETSAIGDVIKLQFAHQGVNCVTDLFSSFWSDFNKAELMIAAKRFLELRNMMRKYKECSGKYNHDVTAIESTATLLANDVSYVKSEVSKICSGKLIFHRIPGSDDFLTERGMAKKAADLLKQVWVDEKS